MISPNEDGERGRPGDPMADPPDDSWWIDGVSGDEHIRKVAADYHAQEAAKRAKAADAERSKREELARHRRDAAQNEAAVRDLAARFLLWAERNHVRPRHYSVGRLGTFTGWEIGLHSESYGDSQSYHYGTVEYALRLSPSGKLHVVRTDPGLRTSGKPLIWRRYRGSGIRFALASVQSSIGRIVAESGYDWP